MTTSELMEAMSAAGAPFEAIIIAIRALEAKDAEIRARDDAAAQKRAADAERKRRERAESTDSPRTVRAASAPPPNDIYSNPHDKPSPSGDGQKPSEIDQVVSAWNAMAKRTGLQRIVKLNAARRRSAKARLAEYGLQAMLDAVARIERSDFCCGRTGSWKGATFDFLISDSKFLRLIEGTYDNHGEGGTPAKPLDDDELRARQLKTAETFERIGRTDEAEEIRRRWATGPPRPIGDLVKRINIGG